MRQQGFEIIFNNGTLRQILILPEAPLKIALYFFEKELILHEKKDGHGLYAISHQKGFPETDRDYESDRELEKNTQNKSLEENNEVVESCKSVAHEWCKESQEFFAESDAFNFNSIKPISDCMRNSNNLHANTGVKSHNNRNSRAVNEINSSLVSPLLEESIEGQNAKSTIEDQVDEEHIICGTLICSQPKILIPTSLQNQTTLRVADGQTNIVSMTMNQNELLVETNAMQSKSIPKEKESIAGQSFNSQTNENGLNDADGDDPMMGDDFYSSKNSNSDKMNVNSVNEICNKEREQNQELYPRYNKRRRRETYRRCAICFKVGKSGMNFFRFPIDPELSLMWAKISKRKWILKASPKERQNKFHVCADHFKPGDFRGRLQNLLMRGTIPTQNLEKVPEISKPEAENAELVGRLKAKLQFILHKKPEKIPPKKKCAKPITKVSEMPQKIVKRCGDPKCCVAKCTSSKSTTPEYSFHKFPSEEDFFTVKMFDVPVSVNRRQEWIKLLKIKKPITDEMFVCSRHFLNSEFIQPRMAHHSPRLKKQTIPTQYLPVEIAEDLDSQVFQTLTC